MKMQHLCLTKSRAGEVEIDDIGIKRSKLLERSMSHILLPPSKVEASSGVERNVLVCIEATQGSGGGLEVSILPTTVVGRKYSKCYRLHEKSGCRVVGQGLRAG